MTNDERETDENGAAFSAKDPAAILAELQGGPPSPADAETEPETERTERVSGLELTMQPHSQRLEFDVDPETQQPVATGYTDVTIRGLWHRSDKWIDRFSDDKARKSGGQGPGTYVGGGDASTHGDRVNQLAGDAHYMHTVALSGNFLLVPNYLQDDASWIIAERAEADGLDLDEVNRMAPGKRLNYVLRRHEIDGVRYDGFLFHGERQAGTQDWRVEGVVLNPETSISIEGVTKHNDPDDPMV